MNWLISFSSGSHHAWNIQYFAYSRSWSYFWSRMHRHSENVNSARPGISQQWYIEQHFNNDTKQSEDIRSSRVILSSAQTPSSLSPFGKRATASESCSSLMPTAMESDAIVPEWLEGGTDVAVTMMAGDGASFWDSGSGCLFDAMAMTTNYDLWFLPY
jgi:hypothetical protein